MNKKKIFRIGFWLSFAPYLFLIIYSLVHAIFGYDVYTMILPQYVRTVFGWAAFSQVFVWTGLVMCFIPIIPICFLVQISYLVGHVIIAIRTKPDSQT